MSNLFQKRIITIGMPVFNDVYFIEKSLLSIVNQTFRDFVLIISDDGSTDGSEAICRKYVASDSRIQYIRQPVNLGISRNMKYLLNQAKTQYFMWAGDDDLMDVTYVEKMILLLQENPNAVSAFSTCSLIDENDDIVIGNIDYDYSNSNRFNRLKFYIKNSTDYFGYGVFVTETIKDVEFPVWWWPNKKTPYNNIFPTLCYYLTKGDFAYLKGDSLFFKRVKTEAKTNHLLVGKNNAVKESFAYWVRKFNLFVFTNRLICKADGFLLSLRISPYLFYYWFMLPSIEQLRLALSSFFKHRVFKKNNDG